MAGQRAVDVTTWTLETTSPDELRPGRAPAAADGVRIVRAHEPSPEFSRLRPAPRFHRSRGGGHLLGEGICNAWTRGTGWTESSGPARRVWVHTCSLDGPHALANYRARGMRVCAEETATESLPDTPPGPWPGHDGRDETVR
jgi:hypothetical protein